MKLTKTRIIFLIIIITGTLLRLLHLSKESLWLDEATSALRATGPISEIFNQAMIYDEHSVLYYVLLNFWVKIFGPSEFSLRLPSVIFSVISIFMMYKVTKLLFDNKVALISALITSLSIFQIQYSQEARAYSLLVLFTLLSIYFFLRLEKETKVWDSTLYTFSSAILLYTHYFGIFILLAQNLYVLTMLIFSKSKIRHDLIVWTISQATVAIIFIPWLQIFTKHLVYYNKIHPLVNNADLYTVFTLFAGSTVLFFYFSTLSFLSFFRIFFRNYYVFFEFRKNKQSLYIIVLWILSGVFLPFIIASFVKGGASPRYLIAGSLGFYILAAKGITSLSSDSFLKLNVVVIIVFSLLGLSNYYKKDKKTQWRNVAEFINNRLIKHDRFFTPFKHHYKPLEYYMGQNQYKKYSLQGPNASMQDVTSSLTSLNDSQRIWYFRYGTNKYTNPISIYFRNNYRQIIYKQYYNLDLYLFEKNNNKDT